MANELHRRAFLKKGILTAGLFSIKPFLNDGLSQMIDSQQFNDDFPTQNEDFWNHVRKEFDVSKRIINLNNGGLSPTPRSVQDAMFAFYKQSNEAPTYYMWRILDGGRKLLRQKIADLAGCLPDEIAINRNSTEALNTILFGLDFKKGDEIVYSSMDYPNMIHALHQREKRDGLVLKKLDLTLPQDNDDVLVQEFTNAFTEKTKLVLITHIINWTGQILPVRKIAEAAHARGIEVLVDAAHSFAQMPFSIADLGVDYLGTSLHKWLYAPFGNGLLYVKKEKISKVWPLLSNSKPQSDQITKFESLGTRSFANEFAIGNAIDFHYVIGKQRKWERLQFLKNYWVTAVKDLTNIHFNTTLDSTKSCAIAHVSLNNITSEQLENKLLSDYKIHTSNIVWEKIKGIRITPNLYTSTRDLDQLVDAFTKLNKL